MSGRNINDISHKEREVREWKAAKRAELRNEYLRELYDPKRTEPLLDTGLQRFYATRTQLEKLYKPTVQNLIPAIILFGLIWGTAEVLNTRKEEREKLYRTGQVKYVDRMFKFN